MISLHCVTYLKNTINSSTWSRFDTIFNFHQHSQNKLPIVLFFTGSVFFNRLYDLSLLCYKTPISLMLIIKIIMLTHWGRVTHICVVQLTSIASDNGLSPGRRQAINWNIAGTMLIGPLGTNFNEILIGIHTFSLTKMHLKMSSAEWRPFVSASMS